jgi:hypothetical protein
MFDIQHLTLELRCFTSGSGRTMKGNNKGQIAIFDALIFLAVSSLVSVSLLSSIAPMNPSTDDESQRYIDRAHAVFLRTSVEIEATNGVEIDGEGRRTLTVFEFVLTRIVEMEAGGDTDKGVDSSKLLSAILDALLLPRFHYSWKAKHDSMNYSFSNSLYLGNRTGGSLYVSTIVSEMPSHKGDVLMILNAWRYV